MRLVYGVMLWVTHSLLVYDDLHLFQQSRYQLERVLAYQREHFTAFFQQLWLSFGIVFLLFVIETQLQDALTIQILFLCVMSYILVKRQSLMAQPLQLTKRIQRFLICYSCFACLFSFLFSYLSSGWQWLSLGILFVGHLGYTIFLFWLLQPIEKDIQSFYLNKAKRVLSSYKGRVIGITGSYGKTSMKNIVNQCLGMKYCTCASPYSYNNMMGLTRTVLECLKCYDEYFIAEMGADHVNEIARLCEFIRPDIGIITAVGPQHLSTFKTMENIVHEKCRLAEYAKEKVFINVDNAVLKEQLPQLRSHAQIITYGLMQEADVQGVHWECNENGSHFQVEIRGKLVDFQTALLGEHNILNCVGAIACAVECGVEVEWIQLAIARLKPIPHRLELKSYGVGQLIDNAYNSNPESAKASLKVLKMMPGRHILITPGFIDLGDKSAMYHERFGEQMAGLDIVCLVGSNAKLIRQGCEKVDIQELVEFKNLEDALSFVKGIMICGDTILIENDLPQIYL